MHDRQKTQPHEKNPLTSFSQHKGQVIIPDVDVLLSSVQACVCIRDGIQWSKDYRRSHSLKDVEYVAPLFSASQSF